MIHNIDQNKRLLTQGVFLSFGFHTVCFFLLFAVTKFCIPERKKLGEGVRIHLTSTSVAALQKKTKSPVSTQRHNLPIQRRLLSKFPVPKAESQKQLLVPQATDPLGNNEAHSQKLLGVEQKAEPAPLLSPSNPFGPLVLSAEIVRVAPFPLHYQVQLQCPVLPNQTMNPYECEISLWQNKDRQDINYVDKKTVEAFKRQLYQSNGQRILDWLKTLESKKEAFLVFYSGSVSFALTY